MADEEEGVIKLEHTPTWVVATVCSVIVSVSLVAERVLHYLGKYLLKKNQKALYGALLKVKEELMLLGFISVLLTVFQGAIQNICIPKSLTHHMLPCRKVFHGDNAATATAQHEHAFFSGIFSSRRHLLAHVSESGARHCARKGKVPLLSIEGLHQLDLFVFVLAITHVTFSVLTILLSGAKISLWKHWEDSIQRDDSGAPLNNVSQFEFLSKRFKGFGRESLFKSWLHSFGKQFYGSVTELDYIALRLGFITMHFRGNPKFNFHEYMTLVLEADFKRVVGIRWYLWIFVFIFLLLNVNSWHTYFWIAFIPLILLLAVGTKLEHVIAQLAHEVADNIAIEGNLVVKPSDDHFWFKRPRIVLYLLHIILFQNAFEIAFFFWILTTVGFNSCFMGQVGFIIPRLVIGVIIQLLSSYSTLPLYALVTQMGSTFKKQISDGHVQEGILGWAQKGKQRRSQKLGSGRNLSWSVRLRGDTTGIHLHNMAVQNDDALMEEGNAGFQLPHE